MDFALGRRRATQAMVVSAVWTLVALFSALRISLETTYSGQPTDWPGALLRGLAHAFPWALSTPLVLALTRRFPLGRRKLFRNATVHVGAGILFSVVNFALYAAASEWVDPSSTEPLTLLELQLNLLLYGALLGAGHAIHTTRHSRERELKTARLEAQLSHARLDLLRTQLHPHFLFNTLNAIAELIHEDAERAEQMIADLSLLLRRTLNAGKSDRVPLAFEIEGLECYLAIERTRFDCALDVVVDVPDEARCALVPHLLLQPIVENAIRHGMEHHPGAGKVAVHAAVRDGDLQLEVTDNGPGFANGGATVAGIGLGNTRERLEQRYGDSHRLTLETGPNGGGRVVVRVPFEPAEDQA